MTFPNLQDILGVLPVALAVIALLQFLYIIFLSATSGIRTTDRPNAPIMPDVNVNNRSNASKTSLASAPMATPMGTPMGSPMGGAPLGGAVVPRGAGLPGIGTASLNGLPGKFIILAGLSGIKEIPLPSSDFAVGRFVNEEHGVTMAMDEKSVSRKHAVFTADEAIREYYLMDTGSTYGTFINKNGRFEQLPANIQMRVYNEDIVQFGSNIRVRLLLPCETRAEAIR